MAPRIPCGNCWPASSQRPNRVRFCAARELLDEQRVHFGGSRDIIDSSRASRGATASNPAGAESSRPRRQRGNVEWLARTFAMQAGATVGVGWKTGRSTSPSRAAKKRLARCRERSGGRTETEQRSSVDTSWAGVEDLEHEEQNGCSMDAQSKSWRPGRFERAGKGAGLTSGSRPGVGRRRRRFPSAPMERLRSGLRPSIRRTEPAATALRPRVGRRLQPPASYAEFAFDYPQPKTPPPTTKPLTPARRRELLGGAASFLLGPWLTEMSARRARTGRAWTRRGAAREFAGSSTADPRQIGMRSASG